jgi:hypothetical protein
MELQDFLQVTFAKSYDIKEMRSYLEFLSQHVSTIRCANELTRGTITTKNGVTLEYLCSSPMGGPITGYAFWPATMNGSISAKERKAVLEIKKYTKQYEKR